MSEELGPAGYRLHPIWEVERDDKGMPCRMWLAGWAEVPRRPLRLPKPPVTPVEDRQERLAL